MRLATPIAILILLAALTGCGGASDGITSSDTSAASAAGVIQATWEHNPDCDRPRGASRWGCSVGGYRCQGVVTDRGWVISCSKPGRSLSFTVRP
jgi:hypothetical protein